jgi:predicted XRE-type DNA-binding protein
MQTYTLKQMEAVTGSTPQELAANYNEAMMRLQGCNPTDEWHEGVVYIYYYTTNNVPETLADQHELAGDAAKCGQCPHCCRKMNRFGNVDTRYKWATCGKTGEPININEAACDIYYGICDRSHEEDGNITMNKDIRIKMIEHDIDQKKLANMLGVSQPAVSQMLSKELTDERREAIINMIETYGATH